MTKVLKPASTTADLFIFDEKRDTLDIVNIGDNQVLAAGDTDHGIYQLGEDWEIVGFGDFSGNEPTDLMVRNTKTGAFDIRDIVDNTITGVDNKDDKGPGLSQTVVGFGDFSTKANETDMMMQGPLGVLTVYDVVDNQISNSGHTIGTISSSWQILGFGDFSTNVNETDLMERDTKTGKVVIQDIRNNAPVGSPVEIGAIGLNWEVMGYGNLSGNPGETDMLMRDKSNGNMEYYDIVGNKITAAGSIGNIGMEWDVLGMGPINGTTTGLVMRDSSTPNGVLKYYDISHNMITAAGQMGALGKEWGSVGFTADHNMTSAMASFEPLSVSGVNQDNMLTTAPLH